MKKIIFSKKSKNIYLVGDAIIDALQKIEHERKALYIRYEITFSGDLREVGEVTREQLKAKFKKHLNEYVFNSLDELESALENGAFERRAKRIENISNRDFTYILI